MASQIPRVDVVFLAYSPVAGKAPSVTLDSICTVSLYELQRHLQTKRTERNIMGMAAYKHYKWGKQYNAVLAKELRTTGKGQPRPLLQAFHWYIETSNRDAFRFDDQHYEAVSLIMAAEVEHWYCARPGHSAHGSRARISFAAQSKITIETTVSPLMPKVATGRQQRRCSTTLEKIREEY